MNSYGSIRPLMELSPHLTPPSVDAWTTGPSHGARSLDDAGSALTSSLDLLTLGDDLLDTLIDAFGAKRGSLLLLNRETGRMRMVAGRGVPAEIIGTDLEPARRRISDWVFRERRSLILNGAVRDRRFDGGVGGAGIESALCFPLMVAGQAIGVANLARVSPSPVFGEDDQLRAECFSPRLAEILNQVQEIAWARRDWGAVKNAADPERKPSLWSTPSYEIVSCQVGSQTARGDFVERMVHDDGSQSLMLADVSGWGAEAQAEASFLRGLFAAFGRSMRAPFEFAKAINVELCRRPAARPVALWLVNLKANGKLTSCVAGLPSPWLVAPGQNRARRLVAGGPVVGALSTAVFNQESLQLLPGDRVLAVTDGIPNAVNAAGEPFGLERVDGLLIDQRQQPIFRVANLLCSEAMAFSGLLSPVDDLAVLALRFSREE